MAKKPKPNRSTAQLISTTEVTPLEGLENVADVLLAEIRTELLKWHDDEITVAMAAQFVRVAFWAGVQQGANKPEHYIALAAQAGYDLTTIKQPQ